MPKHAQVIAVGATEDDLALDVVQVRTLLDTMHRMGCAAGASVGIACGDFNSCAGSPLYRYTLTVIMLAVEHSGCNSAGVHGMSTYYSACLNSALNELSVTVVQVLC